MKKLIVFIFLICFAFSHTLKAQCYNNVQMYDISTPFCNTVITWIMCEDPDSVRRAYDIQFATGYPNAQQVITYNGLSSTAKFNCHGYAWLRTEGGPDRWIGYYANNTDPDIYMSDDSYTEVKASPWPYQAKVFWDRPGDHSGVTTAQQGIINSKWNRYPLMVHAVNYGPYWGSSTFKYYVKTTSFSISGPSQVCSIGASFTLTPSPKCSIQWSVSGPFTVSTPNPSNPSTVIVTHTGANNNSGTLTASFNGNVVATKAITPCPPTISGPTLICRNGESYTASYFLAGFTWDKSYNLSISGSGTSISVITTNTNYTSGELGWISIKNSDGTELVKKEIWIGYPDVEIDGPDYGSYGRYTAVYNPLSNPNFYWYVNVPYPNTYTLYSYGSYADIYFHNSATYEVTLNACNNCGCSPTEYKYVSGYAKGASPSPFITYPNPVDDILTIEIDEQDTQQQVKAANITYDIRLYDVFGTLRRQTTTKNNSTQINVSDLPNGFYYLHIYDGVSDKPDMRTIVVKH